MNGTWRAQVTLQGKRLNFNAKTHKECQEWLKKTIGQIDDGMTYDTTRITFGTSLEDWLTSTKASVKSQIWKQYHQICTDYIVPRLGRIKLKDLRPEQTSRGFAYVPSAINWFDPCRADRYTLPGTPSGFSELYFPKYWGPSWEQLFHLETYIPLPE